MLKVFRRGVLLVALTLPMAGCLEMIGHPLYNHGPATAPTCGLRSLGGQEGQHECIKP